MNDPVVTETDVRALLEAELQDCKDVLRRVRRLLEVPEGGSITLAAREVYARKNKALVPVFFDLLAEILRVVHGIPFRCMGVSLEPYWSDAVRAQKRMGL